MVALLPLFLLLLMMFLMMMMLLETIAIVIYAARILDGKEEAVQFEGVCGLWFHRYSAEISATHFQRLSTTNAPFVCFNCYQYDQHVLTAPLQSAVISLKAEIKSTLCCMVLMNMPHVCQDQPDKNQICPLLLQFFLQ